MKEPHLDGHMRIDAVTAGEVWSLGSEQDLSILRSKDYPLHMISLMQEEL